MDGTIGNFGDYEYIHYALEDFPEAREVLMRKLDGLRIRVKLHEYKRFTTQQRLIAGDKPKDIAGDLEMTVKAVQNIKYRMQHMILREQT